MTCRPTRPCSGWSKDSGTVPMIWNPSDRHRCTAAAFDSTTALNWMLAKPAERHQPRTYSPRARPTPRPVGPHLRGAHDGAVADGCDRLAGRLLHPPRPGLVEGLVLGERIGLPLGHDRGIEGIDQRPVLIPGLSDVHGPDSTA